MEKNEASSFSSFHAYVRALSDTPRRLALRAGSVSTSLEETSHVRALSGGGMKRSLRWYDLVGFGLGGMVGAGIFVTAGHASHDCAGPAVILSFAIAGLCALLSAFCYTEFAVEMPVAGGAFSYIRTTFGEFLAFITGANLIIDYVLSNEIDFVAVAVVLALTVVICYSTRGSSVFNMTLTVLHILFIVFVIAIGFSKGDSKNLTHPADPKLAGGFSPFGASGVFSGAAMVYLSYIGYDAVSTMAEEVRNPVKDIPIGVSGSVILVTILYCLMAASLSMLLPYDRIDPDAPFNGAFSEGSRGWRWVSNVIGAGASFGILTSLLVAMLGQARYMCVIGRSGVVPNWFAKVHPRTSTPVNASVFLGIFTAAIALFTDLQILLNLVTIGTLFVFYMVANAVIYKRYVTVGSTNPWPTLSYLFCFTLTSVLFTLLWHCAPPGKAKALVLGGCTLIAIAILQLFQYMVPQAKKPELWGVPLMPWIPSMSIFLNIFLLGSLDRPSYIRFGFFSGLAVIVYVLYSVHASFDAGEQKTLGQENIEMGKEYNVPRDHSLKV
ncbi:PREDICTED: cationic amino acid transporter 7, chloroplastic-like isoform X3 [Ipomoea nil]|uniref:cationic amino acid transporter 7, chloroplastic-like isoform X3 n=1 Tax=Ipomoea nil TaxID=35883 RepID=UPI000901C491|nr:PREDICTED: cationic amino acid transporter 7, chloroplastic-like isoform X3 [Ipomoea nil]